MSLKIEKAKSEHIPAILALLREFAEYEDLSQFVEATEESFHAALFGAGAVPSVAEAIVAVVDGKIVGYAVFYPNFATFRGQRGVYLEDIYIQPEHRRSGAGEAMLRHIARLAKSRGYERMDFMVLDWNTAAIGFYQKLGAVIDDSERHFKFTDEAFKNLAS